MIMKTGMRPAAPQSTPVHLLISRLQEDHAYSLGVKFLTTQLDNDSNTMTRRGDNNISSTINKLKQNAGIGASDAYAQLLALGAIDGDVKSMTDHSHPYPEEFRSSMNCHLRAIFNVSQQGADDAYGRGIRHMETGRIKNYCCRILPKEGVFFIFAKTDPVCATGSQSHHHCTPMTAFVRG